MVITPVEELYAMPAPAKSEVLPSLPLNTDQSELVRTPRLVAEEEGRLNVIVCPEPVTVKSFPVVEVANVTAPLATCWPTGPTAVIVPVFEVKQTPPTETQPLATAIPFVAVVVAPVKVTAPVTVVEPFMVDEAEETKPPRSVVTPVTASVPVAVTFAPDTFPEKSPLPWTDNTCDGEVVPRPKSPEPVKTVPSKPVLV